MADEVELKIEGDFRGDYFADNGDIVDCTCDNMCPRPCTGECGCEACHQYFLTDLGMTP